MRAIGQDEVAAAGWELNFGGEEIAGVVVVGLGIRSLGELHGEKVPRGALTFKG